MTFRDLFAQFDQLTSDAAFAAIVSAHYGDVGGQSTLANSWRDASATLTAMAAEVRRHVTQLEQLGV